MRQPSLAALFSVFFRLGCTSFGGGLTGWIQREVVEKHAWMTAEEFYAGVALCQVLPGGNNVNLCLYIGLQLRGTPGLITTGFGMLAPPFVIIVLMGIAYSHGAGPVWLTTALAGLAACGVGIMLETGVKAVRRLSGAGPILVAAATFAAIGVLHWPLVPVVAVVVPASLALSWVQSRRRA